MEAGTDKPLRIEVTPEDLELIRAGLKMLLSAEDDPQTIAELKVLIQRLSAQRS